MLLTEVRVTFTIKRIGTLQTLADRAVIAEKGRLFEAEWRRKRESNKPWAADRDLSVAPSCNNCNFQS